MNIFATYILIGKDVGTRFMSEYYNVRLHKFIWINGMTLNQLEEVKPEVTVMDFGIDCTGCSSLIRNELKVVKHV
jgi:hypothetical protein